LQDGDATTPSTSSVKLPRDQEKLLLKLLDSTAVQKYQEGVKQELTFSDACRFWDVSEQLRGDALDSRLSRLRRSLADLEHQLGPDGVDLSNGRNVSAEDIAQLRGVEEYLTERFSRHLTLWRNRVAR